MKTLDPKQQPQYHAQIRITKYDSSKRDPQGAFHGKTWTSLYDDVDISEYLAVEAQYVDVVMQAISMCQLISLQLNCIEYYSSVQELRQIMRSELLESSLESLAVLQATKESRLRASEVPHMIRLSLREIALSKLSGARGFYVHFGYDLYLYLGTTDPEFNASKLQSSLFLETEFPSPYQTSLNE